MSQFKDVEVGSIVYFWFAANLTTGAAGDGATPLYDVRLAGAAAGAAPTASGTPTLLTHANYPDGLHEIAIDTTGYAEGEYAVFFTLLISTVNPAGFAGSFKVVAVGKSLHSAVVDAANNAYGAYVVATNVYTIVSHASYGNAQLVRATTPDNALDVDADGNIYLGNGAHGGAAAVLTLLSETINGRKVFGTSMSQVGIGQAAFHFTLTSTATTPKVLSSATSTVLSSVHELDGSVVTTRYTAATLGTQWVVSVDEYVLDESGIMPFISYSSSDESVATVSSDGVVSYVGDGTATITATSLASEYSPTQVESVTITNTSYDEAEEYEEVTFVADALDPAKHILIIYNADSSDSMALKNYYIANRPGMATANVLGVTGIPDTTSTTVAATITSLMDQIYNWLVANEAEKPIRYAVVMRGIPSRQSTMGALVTDLYWLLYDRGYRTGTSYNAASDRFTRYEYPGTTCLPAWLDCGSYPASLAYIDKLKAVADAGGLQADGVTIRGTPVQGDQWYLDEKRSLTTYPSILADDAAQLLTEGIAAEDITYQSVITGPAITACADCAFFMCWGLYAHGANWPNADTVIMSGNSSWWLAASVESFNGMYAHATHGDPTEFFAADAFGGAAYENTPIGFVGHTAEPWLSGVSSKLYCASWARGWSFAEAAWSGAQTYNLLVVGDPLVTR